MICLRINSLFLLIVLFLTGCTTSYFRLLKQEENAAELKVTSDRILLECEHQPDHDSKDAYGFLMYILDDEDTVVSFVQTNVLDKASCFRRIQKIGKILKTGKEIYVGGMGYLTKPKTPKNKRYNFPAIGTFNSNGRVLQFIVIANEHGSCYDAYSGEEKPCPREPFPLRKNDPQKKKQNSFDSR